MHHNKVCRACNIKVSREVEGGTIESLAFFQNIWGIKNRQGKVPPVRAKFKFGGEEEVVSLDDKGQPARAIVTKRVGDSRTKTFLLAGRTDNVEEKKREIENRHPEIQWMERSLEDTSPPESVVTIALDLCGQRCRRFAAKVAFKQFSMLRASDILCGEQFDHVREFILNGEESFGLWPAVGSRFAEGLS